MKFETTYKLSHIFRKGKDFQRIKFDLSRQLIKELIFL